MFGKAAPNSQNLHFLEQVETWTREVYKLLPHCLVLVSEELGKLPGYPPLMTVVLFWDEMGTRYRFAIFKPVALVQADDLPVHWLLPSLVDDVGDCC